MERAKIHLLPSELRNQIAAGEVVERPASVVKELVENALDAKATDIEVRIEDGGQSLISVQDNGIGIPQDELELAVTRHATSKLQTVSDLSHILSYGFRGEALPSIASVSRFRIISKTKDDDIAHELSVNFGDIAENVPASLRQGTLIEVRDLFFNIPARLKFLKNPATELKRATELFIRLALGADNVAMRLFAGTRQVIEFFDFEDKKQKLAKIWSQAIIEELVPVNYENYGIKIYGYISNPRSVQPRADRMLLYVNGRAVSDKIILKAVRQAYLGKITTRDYPQCLLFLEIDPREIDVNVHPAKSEVRFRNEKALFGVITKAVNNALADCEDFFSVKDLQKEEITQQAQLGDLYQPTTNIINTTNNNEPKPLGFWGNADKETRLSFAKENQQNVDSLAFEEHILQKNSISEQQEKDIQTSSFVSNKEFSYVHSFVADPISDIFTEKEKNISWQVKEKGENIVPLSKDFSEKKQESVFSNSFENKNVVLKENTESFSLPYGLEYLGQVAETYLIIKKDDNALMLLDQHAAHERILYEEMKKGIIQTQGLLCPIELPLHKSEESRFFDVSQTLKELGFIISYEQKEQGMILSIEAIPRSFDRIVATGFLKEILAERLDNMDSLWVQHACKSAIKANTPLDRAAAIKLIVQWLATEEPDNCPHGRPAVLHFSALDLEKMFKRKF